MRSIVSSLLIILVIACGRKKDNSSDASLNLVVNDVESQNQVSIEEISGKNFDLQSLHEMGLHLQAKSNLGGLGNPPVIYCSNTYRLNHEKIEELIKLNQFIKQDGDEFFTIGEIRIKKDTLITMVQNSIRVLETEPYSRFCPQIYLSI